MAKLFTEDTWLTISIPSLDCRDGRVIMKRDHIFPTFMRGHPSKSAHQLLVIKRPYVRVSGYLFVLQNIRDDHDRGGPSGLTGNTHRYFGIDYFILMA
jgi:hypothetical protein